MLSGLFLRLASFCAAGFCANAVAVPLNSGPAAPAATATAVDPATWRNSRRRTYQDSGVTSDSRMSGDLLDQHGDLKTTVGS